MNWSETDLFPKCVFYNETTGTYDGAGCYVLTRTAFQTVCACLHATYFGVEASSMCLLLSKQQLLHYTLGSI